MADMSQNQEQVVSVARMQVLVAACFERIYAALVSDGSAPPEFADLSSISCPFFVTLTTRDKTGSYSKLRGCIGTLAPSPIAHITDFALKSAFEDSRFPPLELVDLPTVRISISLLVCFEPAATELDWVVGVHGIKLQLTAHSRTYSATFLPEVASEQKWDKQSTIAALARKAGYEGRLDDVSDIRITRYQSTKCGLTYSEWLAGRGGQLPNISLSS